MLKKGAKGVLINITGGLLFLFTNITSLLSSSLWENRDCNASCFCYILPPKPYFVNYYNILFDFVV
jgi:hypothetical protein